MAVATARPRARKTTPKIDLSRPQRVIFYVTDFDRAVKFYQETLGLKPAYPAEDGWASFQLKGIELSIHSGREKNTKGDHAYFGFQVSDVDAARLALKARGVKVGEIVSPCEGTRFFGFKDPDGNHMGCEGR